MDTTTVHTFRNAPVGFAVGQQFDKLKPEHPWTPKAGEPCKRFHRDSSAWQEVVPLCVRKKWSWVAKSHESDTAEGELVYTSALAPLPSKPPVKVGDIIQLDQPIGRLPVFGQVSAIAAHKKRFWVNTTTGNREVRWDVDKWVKLIPETKP